jgi:hypothetical protein
MVELSVQIILRILIVQVLIITEFSIKQIQLEAELWTLKLKYGCFDQPNERLLRLKLH